MIAAVLLIRMTISQGGVRGEKAMAVVLNSAAALEGMV
jgi:hypothetical protein